MVFVLYLATVISRTASRIRESGLIVYGFGRSNTPEAFRKACDKFIYVENTWCPKLKKLR